MHSYTYDRLSAQDNLFLVMESTETPMHIGAVMVLEANPGRDRDVSEDDVDFRGGDAAGVVAVAGAARGQQQANCRKGRAAPAETEATKTKECIEQRPTPQRLAHISILTDSAPA